MPINIDIFKIKFIVKTYFCQFSTDLLKDELWFDVEMIIIKLYDTNNDIISKNKSIDHNVQISI